MRLAGSAALSGGGEHRAPNLSRPYTMATESFLRFASLNVRGLASRKKQNQLYRLVVERDLDVIAVQETKVEGEQETGSMVRPFSSRFSVCISHAIGSSAGCALFVRQIQGLVVESVTSSLSGRLVVCDFRHFSSKWRVITVYAPNVQSERCDFFQSLDGYCDTDRQLVIMGDFNCVLSAHDKTSNAPYRDRSTAALSDIIDRYSLEDVAECLDAGQNIHFTHFQNSSHARLDRAYVTASIIPMCNKYVVEPVFFTDHCLICFNIRCGGARQSKFSWDLWKLNSQLLEDDIFKEKVLEHVGKINKTSEITIGAQWEYCKSDIKMMAMERACAIKREKRKEEELLKHNFTALLEEEAKSPGTFSEDIRKARHKLEVFDIERYKGAIIRARAEKLLVGEAPTKRSLGEEKRYARKNTIEEIHHNGVVYTDNKGIENVFSNYYRDLFKRSEVDIGMFREKFLPLMSQVPESLVVGLELPISNLEVERAIERLNPGKSPGPDGLSAAFYKTFKSDLSPILTCLFNEAYKYKMLPPTFLTAHTILIPKTDDKTKLRFIKSYRPISLTNVDYKIFMKILAKRLQGVIKEIVGPHQTCGIKGRTIATNIHKARSVLECCDATETCVAMLQLDLEKAFDLVSHDVLMSVLDFVNVGCIIKEGVAMAYKGCTTQLIVNKLVGARINLQRSVRQGCPLSPLLFSLFLEPFCVSVMNSSAIRGFKLHENEVRLLAYADDVAVFCSDCESVNEVVYIAKQFCTASGSSVNWEKCLGCWHGDWPSTPVVFANMPWVNQPAKYLGVPLEFYRDSEPYWRRQATEMREKVDNVRGWDFSIFTRATICNLFFVSKLWYTLQVLHCSRINVQKLHRVFAVFIWGSVWERSSRTNLFRRVRFGGLSLSHLFLRQVVSRFMFLRDTRDPFLRAVIQLRLGRVLPSLVVSSDYVHGALYGYLKEVVGACNFLLARFSSEYLAGVKRKRLYRDLLDIVLPVPLYRSLYPAGRGENVLARVKKMAVPSSSKSFFFKLHTGTLEVKTWMHERGLFVPWGTHCFLCCKPETIEHVFLDCWEGVFFWDILQRTIKKDLPIDAYGIRFLPVNEEDDGAPYDTVMLLGLHSIWKKYMAVRHADINTLPIREYFRQMITKFIEECKTKDPIPEWLEHLEPLIRIKEF